MTGYGRAVETVNGREYTVEVRSVNNRYLDASVRLPRSLTFAEDAVKQAIKASVSRGKVEMYVTVHTEGGEDVVDTSTVEVKLIKDIENLTAGISENGIAALFDKGFYNNFCT